MSDKNGEPNKLKKILQSKKFQEVFWYLVFGVLTTLVDFMVFAALNKLIDAKWPVKLFKWNFDLFDTFANVVAWLVAMIFAYVTNKIFVFHSKGKNMKEFISFLVARLFTLFAFVIGLFSLGVMVMENVFNMPKDALWFECFGVGVKNIYIVKILASVFNVIGNYIFSKFFIFKNDKPAPEKESDNNSENDPETAEEA